MNEYSKKQVRGYKYAKRNRNWKAEIPAGAQVEGLNDWKQKMHYCHYESREGRDCIECEFHDECKGGASK